MTTKLAVIPAKAGIQRVESLLPIIPHHLENIVV
jgi:hypothetical protein